MNADSRDFLMAVQRAAHEVTHIGDDHAVPVEQCQFTDGWVEYDRFAELFLATPAMQALAYMASFGLGQFSTNIDMELQLSVKAWVRSTMRPK